MTVVKRRPKAKVVEPWPSQQVLPPRITTSGKVSSLPSPIQAMWAEAEGRARDGGPYARDEAEGLCVAIAILWCQPLEQVREELAERVRAATR